MQFSIYFTIISFNLYTARAMRPASSPQINTGDRKGNFDEILKYSFVCHVILYDTLKSEAKV
jgi:hypothetical protein